jgi:hypothetical protein
MKKMGVHNAASLTVLAVQMGICPTKKFPASGFGDLKAGGRLTSLETLN